MSEGEKRLWHQSSIARRSVWIVLLVVAIFVYAPIRNLFRLDANDTVYDFQTASVNKQVDFLIDACRNGECITRTDWACGFYLDAGDNVSDCISEVVEHAKPWVRLDSVRKFCGQKFMTFEGTLYGNEEKCHRQHGVWGKPSPAQRVAF